MEDYQTYSRRDPNYKAKNTPEFLYVPKKTPAQTFGISVFCGCAIMVLAYLWFNGTERYHKKFIYQVEENRKLRKTHMPSEMYSIGIRDDRMRAYQNFRRNLRLPDQPPSASLISDPDLRNPQPRGQMTL